MRNAYDNFLNLKQNKTAQLLARYVDKRMRGEKGVDDSEIEIQLDKVGLLETLIFV